MARIIQQELDGKKIAYTDCTVFRVQSGRYAKGAYKNRISFTGNLTAAVLNFNAINIGNGYKKRLVMETMSKNVVLARATSY